MWYGDEIIICEKCTTGGSHVDCLDVEIPDGVDPLSNAFVYTCPRCRGVLPIELESYGLRSKSTASVLASHWAKVVAARKGGKVPAPLTTADVQAKVTKAVEKSEVELTEAEGTALEVAAAAKAVQSELKAKKASLVALIKARQKAQQLEDEQRAVLQKADKRTVQADAQVVHLRAVVKDG